MNILPLFIGVIRLALVIVLGLVGAVAQNRSYFSREKSSAYECGLDPNISARIPLSLRFFLLAVIFLVFDVEIALLIAVPISSFTYYSELIVIVSIFLLILFLGLLHE